MSKFKHFLHQIWLICCFRAYAAPKISARVLKTNSYDFSQKFHKPTYFVLLSDETRENSMTPKKIKYVYFLKNIFLFYVDFLVQKFGLEQIYHIFSRYLTIFPKIVPIISRDLLISSVTSIVLHWPAVSIKVPKKEKYISTFIWHKLENQDVSWTRFIAKIRSFLSLILVL